MKLMLIVLYKKLKKKKIAKTRKRKIWDISR